MIRQVMRQGGRQVTFGWQGGEPTLMGLRFYEHAVEFQQRYGRGQIVGNGLQTNGILIDGQWARFLGRYNFLVGLSIDGPQHIHDRYRLLRGGKGSWQRAADSAKRLLEAGVAVNALTVVNDYSVDFPEEIYEFHRDLGLSYMQFIPCVEPNPDKPDETAKFSVPPRKYGEFLMKLFDLWLADFSEGKPITSIRFFESVFHSYAEVEAPECILMPECGVYVVVEHNGDVFSCDFFVEPAWMLGNVKNGSLSEMLNSDTQSKFGLMKSDLPPLCRECEWLRYCRGGCTKDRKYSVPGDGVNHLCESYSMFFQYADRDFQRLAESWKMAQRS